MVAAQDNSDIQGICGLQSPWNANPMFDNEIKVGGVWETAEQI